MIIEFDFTEDDFLHFNRYHFENSPTMRRTRRLSMLWGPVLGLAIFFCLSGEPVWARSFMAVLAAFLYFIFLHRAYTKGMLKNVRKMLAEGHNRAMIGHKKVELSQEGVSYKGTGSEGKASWATVERIAQDETYIYIYLSSIMAVIVPKRAFPNPEASNEYYNEANRFLNGVKIV